MAKLKKAKTAAYYLQFFFTYNRDKAYESQREITFCGIVDESKFSVELEEPPLALSDTASLAASSSKKRLNITLYPDWSPAQLLLPGFHTEVLSETDPTIMLFHHLISDEEIVAVRELMDFFDFKRSGVVGNKITADRTSDTSYLCQGLECEGIAGGKLDNFFKRIQLLAGCSWEHLEIMSVRYKKGQQYKAHYDFLGDEFMGDNGERVVTFFVYLNTVEKEQGGATAFPKLVPKLSVQPVKGSGLFWRNQIPSGMDFKTEHAGEPLLSGEKYAMNVWIREKGYSVPKKKDPKDKGPKIIYTELY